MRWAIGVALLALAGCQTKPIAEMSYDEVLVIAKQIGDRCEKHGPEGSPVYQACVKQEVSREHAMRAANRAQMRRTQLALAEGMQKVSDSYNQAAKSNTYAAQPRVTCRSQPMGAGTYSTSCY